MKTPRRIVSLLPGSTEIVCALGLRGRLVGVSHECDHPADVVGLPVLTKPKLNLHVPSDAINKRVQDIVREGLSIYRINTDILQSLRPELIITQDQCRVCAVSLPEVEEAVRCFLSPDVAVVSLNPQRLSDIWHDIQRVAEATGQQAACGELLKERKRRLWKLEQTTRHLPRPRVACIEWLSPLMGAGNWMPELIAIAGGECDLVAAGDHSPVMAWETLLAFQPDVVILTPCGFKIAQTQADLSSLTRQPQWQQLPAVQSRRVYVVDGNAYMNRPGPRIVESAEILAEVLHPEECRGLAPAGAYIHVGGEEHGVR